MDDYGLDAPDSRNTFTRGSILDEAKKIINGERMDSYGNPENSFDLVGKLWQIYLDTLPKDHKLNSSNIATMMVLFKIARQCHQHKRDNLVDAAGYLGILGDLESEND